VGLVNQIAAITQKSLPLLEVEKTCQQISNILYPHVEQNPMFRCSIDKDAVCNIVVKTTVKPVLVNICVETTDTMKKKTYVQTSQ
jgi:hypothetical protein